MPWLETSWESTGCVQLVPVMEGLENGVVVPTTVQHLWMLEKRSNQSMFVALFTALVQSTRL